MASFDTASKKQIETNPQDQVILFERLKSIGYRYIPMLSICVLMLVITTRVNLRKIWNGIIFRLSIRFFV